MWALLGALWSIVKKGVLPLILGFIAVAYDLYIKQQVMHAFPHGYGFLLGLVPQGTYIIGAGALLSGLIQVASIVKDPFRIQAKDFLDKPDYKDKLGFIGSFEDDFSRIVSVATHPHFGWKPQKLVIFIDDLDRCRPLQTVSIVEAISLFLDSKQCVFVIGMDPAAVATSIEAKYKELAERIRRETPEVVSPGSLFLDKIVQIPFNIPRPTDQTLKELVDSITSPNLMQSSPLLTPQSAAASSLQSAPTESQFDRASFVHDDVREAIDAAIKLLKKNPRQVKRFINLFRLQVSIANQLGLLEERISNNQSSGLSLKTLAIWVAWSMQWPGVVKLLLDEIYGSGVQAYLEDISKCLQDDGGWKPQSSNQDNGNRMTMTTKLDGFIKDLKQKRKEEENSPAHWYHLPWDVWIRDNDFRYCLKQMENFWLQLDTGKDNELQHTLDLARLITL